MATTLIAPVTASRPSPGEMRFVAVRANLMPVEIISRRQTAVVRKQVMVALFVVVGLLIAWFALSWWQTSSANDDLSNAQNQGVVLQNQQQQFGPLVQAQGEVQSVQSQLRSLMTGDLSWKSMFTTLRSKAPSGVKLTSITGNVTGASAGGAAAAAPVPLNETGKLAVGQLTLSGSAPDKKAVAAYADRLSAVKGLAVPLVSNVATTGGSATFTMTVVITSDSLGGRYAAAPAPVTTGGH